MIEFSGSQRPEAEGSQKASQGQYRADLMSMDSKKLWDSMKAITNMNTTKKHLSTDDDLGKANELNDFFLRFENHDFSKECNNVMQTILTDVSCRIVIDPLRIQSIFKHVCTKKSTGPDGIAALLLKACAEELTPAWCPIFQRSVDSHTVPALWKKSIIDPVAKKTCPVDNNDFRPMALTSIIMKSFEKYMLSVLKAEANLVLMMPSTASSTSL